MSCLVCVSSFHVSSCLMSHHCVLTVCLSGVANCLFCVETLAFLAESRLLAVYLLTYLLKRLILWLSLFYGYNVSWLLYLSNVSVSSILTASQSRLSPILNVFALVLYVPACVMQCFMSQAFEWCLSLLLSRPNLKCFGLSRILTSVFWQMSLS